MKQYFSVLFILSLLISNISGFAQNASVTWPLSAATTITPVINGNATGADETFSDLTIRDYTGTSTSQRSQIVGTAWPAEGVYNVGRYIQFAASPASGNNMSITNIQLLVGASGGSNMRVAIAYSKDPAFTSSTVIYTFSGLPITSLNIVTNSPAGLMLLNGETLYLRVYPYYGAAISGKYIVLKDVVISGTTSNATAAPTVSTVALSNVGSSTATSGGSVSVDGGSAITQKGVVWSTSPNPTVASNNGMTNDGNGMAAFASYLTGLTPNTVHYVRAYATNSTGTGYGNEIQFATTLAGTNFFNKPNSDLTNLANWGTNTDGTGSAPTSFSNNGHIYNIVNNGGTMSSYWVVLGTDSKVILGDGVQPVAFTIPSAYGLDGIIDLKRSAKLTVKNKTGLTLGSMNDTSTVVFDGINVIPTNYPNLEIANGANFPSSGTVGIRGYFYPHGGGVATPGSTIAFYGNSEEWLPGNFIFDSLRLDRPFANNPSHVYINRGLVVNENLVVRADTFRLVLYNSASLTIAPGKQVVVYGIFDNQSTGPVNLNNGNLVIKSGGSYLVNAPVPSSYNIPAATFEPGSDLVVMKGTGKLAASVGGNVIWNGTNTTANMSASITVGGNFIMNSGGLNQGGNRTLTVNGNFIMNGGSYLLGPDGGAGFAQHMVINGNLIINNGDFKLGGVTTAANYYSTLTVKGNITQTGGSLGTDYSHHGKLVLNGVNQTIIATALTNTIAIEVGTDSTACTLQLGSNITLPPSSLLKIVNGNLVVLPNKILTIAGTADFNGKHVLFKSDSTGTGTFGKMTGTLTGANNVTVERYISSLNKGAYRLLAPSLNTASSIQDNWQTGASGYATYIHGGIPGANGFDIGSSNNSAYTYNVDITPTTDIVPAWIPLPNTNVKKLEADSGYLVYIKGDRLTDINDTTSTSHTTLTATGSLVTGTRVFSNLRPTVYNLITNPYASAINFAGILASNPDLANRYIYWDPNVGEAGGYVVINGDGSATPPITTTNPGMNIQPGQAFFVRPLNTTSVSIQEEHKSSINNLNIFRTGSQSEKLTASLYFRTANNKRRMADGVSALYNNTYSAGFANEDALQLANFGEDVAIISNSRQLAIEGRPLIDSNETLQLYIDRLKPRTYEWEISAGNFNPSILSAVLKDNFTNTSTPLNLNGTSVINFKVTADAASADNHRFQVIYATAKTVADTVDVNMCAGGNTIIASNITGTQYQWQVHNGSSFVNITNNTNYQGVSTANLQVTALPASLRGTRYRCAVTTSGNTTYSKTFTVVYRNYWTGAESDAWENPANWSCGELPNEFTDVFISAGPVKVNTTAICRSLQVSNEVEVTVKQGAVLETRK